MTKFYVEIIEEVEEPLFPVEIVRVYVTDEEEAKTVYSEEIKKFKDKKVKGKYVTTNHDTNKPCKLKLFDEEGELEVE